ncbi:MAG: DUF4091 domain-containing protein, partial [Calditrichaeota bacterium]|nr:DUF4091 domain-containing protein [Calditrichota bacterium]
QSFFSPTKILHKTYDMLNRTVTTVKAATKEDYLQSIDYGNLIGTFDGITLWWTDGVRKISRERPAPVSAEILKKPAIHFSAAKNEYEPMQLVLRASQDLENISAKAGPLVNAAGKKLPLEAVKIMLVDYVDIQHPTDEIGSKGFWPDPLPPLRGRFSLKKGQNQPLWILIYVPANTQAGDYTGEITLKAGTWKHAVAINLHVWDFTLPKTTHLQSAFGFAPWWVKQYHHLSDSDDIRPVWDKYFKSFAQHRISPYDPFVNNEIRTHFDEKTLTVKCDFSKFDAAGHKYLDQFGFNSFRLRVEGLGKGTFYSHTEGKIGTIRQGSPEYKKLMADYLTQIRDHLKQRNWLDKAYIYWFDEPKKKDYPFVRETMRMLKDAAPGLTRMLTEQPEPELYGFVDLWCPVTKNFDYKIAQQRMAKGERFWWYICTSPKAPYCTLFIDHYAVELRTWIWQSWKYGLDGILIWQSTYWTSPAAYPKPKWQNPYKDPMSYRSGYDTKSSEIRYWGNGDGRFIYPPKTAFQSNNKNYDDPVSSIRWEMLREGMEDYEYFWLLRRLVQKAEKKSGNTQLVQKARSLLHVPAQVTSGLKDFSTSPEPLFVHRAKIAEMIERLKSL